MRVTPVRLAPCETTGADGADLIVDQFTVRVDGISVPIAGHLFRLVEKLTHQAGGERLMGARLARCESHDRSAGR